MVMAFAVAVQAGDGKTCQDKDAAACGSCKIKTAVQTSKGTDQAAPSCSASKVKTSVETKGGCCKLGLAGKQASAKRSVLLSPKASSVVSN